MLDFMDNAPATKSKEEKKLESLMEEKQQLMNEQTKKYLESLFEENSQKPVILQNVHILNSEDFRNEFLIKQFLPLNKRHFTLSSFFQSVDEVSKNLSKSTAITNLEIDLNTQGHNDKLIASPIFKLVPVKKFFAKTGSNIGNGEGDGYIQFQWRNIFGGGENLSFDATTGTRTTASYLLNYSMPWFNKSLVRFDTSAYFNSRSMEWINSETVNRGITTKFTSSFKHYNFNFQIDNIWRNLHNVNSKSWDIITQSGPNFKSALSASVNFDDRNNVHLPSEGRFFQLGIEVNGLIPQADKFIKTMIEGQYALPLNKYHNLILTSKSGILLSEKSSYVLDRFFIGGPNDVRSFMLNGLGPKSYGDSLGGDIFLNGGISLVSAIPRYPESNFKFHNFINWGSLKLLDENFLNHQFSVGYGFGILYNHPMARFELNFVLPLTSHQRDSIRKGLQYGIGVSFL